MSRRLLPAPARLALLALLALAAPSHADPRLVTQRFNADQVVRLPGRSGIQATIAFAADEHIENVAIGDSAAWQVTPNKRANMLFVKPLAPRARTNMTVVTDRYTYLFDLAAAPDARPLYVLRFAYPDEPKRAASASTQPALTEDEAQAATGKIKDAATDPARLNFAWTAKGKAALIPARIYDDGQSTFLAFAPRAAIPAIQVRNESGVEGPINYAVRDDVIVLDGVPPAIVLRAGRDSALLERTAPQVLPAPQPDTLAAAQPAPGK